jgi:cell division protein FtsB
MSTHRRKKKKYSPVGAIIAMVVLLAVIGASVYGALRFRGQYRELKAEKEVAIALAEEDLAAARAELAALDLSGPEGSQILLDAQEEALEKARGEAVALEAEIDALNEEIARLEAEIALLEQDEDYAYFRAIYEAYREGRDHVEELIARG